MKTQRARVTYEIFTLVMITLISTSTTSLEYPEFSEPINNITVPVGREAVFSCVVQDLGRYKVAWLRVDTQTILTIQNHLLTRNKRISITHSENSVWFLHIKEVKESDQGLYMCQINTDPMKMQVGYLQVVVPPDILDYSTSTDVIAQEGDNVTLQCTAKGTPKPAIIWKREQGKHLRSHTDKLVSSVEGFQFSICRVTRHDMGSYLCIASNGVPPSISKRIMIIVNFSPIVRVENQLLSAYNGMDVVLRCYIEAHPKPISYWTNENGDVILTNQKFRIEVVTDGNYVYEIILTIKNVNEGEFGVYHCISKNSLGEAEFRVKLHQIENSSLVSEGSKVTIYHSNLSQKVYLQSGSVSSFISLHTCLLLLLLVASQLRVELLLL